MGNKFLKLSTNRATRKFHSRGKRCNVRFPLESALKDILQALSLVLNTWALNGEEIGLERTLIELNCCEVLDTQEDKYLKTGTWLNEHAIWPSKEARELDRQS